MCGRYIVRLLEQSMREWNVSAPENWIKVSYNVAPTQDVPIIRMRHGARQGAVVRWGLIPFFAGGEPPKYSTINARVETIETAPAWRGPWSRGQRCLQLCSGFYEWHQDEHGRKVPYFVSLADQETFAFASLWDRSRKTDGPMIESCALVTLPANELMHDLHNTGANPHRMPAILRREDHEAWLQGTIEEARAALRQYSSDVMTAHPVSTRVNTPKNDDEKLIEVADDSSDPPSKPSDSSPQAPLF
jgi:putative SOS response-associated peptidase YedK